MGGLVGGIGVGLTLGWLAGGRLLIGRLSLGELLVVVIGLLALVGEAMALTNWSAATAAAAGITLGIMLRAAWLRFLVLHGVKAHKDWRES